jgi:hypothetical protein
MSAVQTDLARQAEQVAAAEAARRLADQPVGNMLPATAEQNGPAKPDKPDSRHAPVEGRFFAAPSAIKPADSDSGVKAQCAGFEAVCAVLSPLAPAGAAVQDDLFVLAGRHHPVYQAQAPPQA